MHLEPYDYRIYYVNIDLRHQYGISVAESQTYLLAKRPSAAMSEEKRLPFAGYKLKTVSLSRIARDNLMNNADATIYNNDEHRDIS